MTTPRKQPLAQTIGGIVFGFEQQVLRTSPPPHELVHHARPDDPVPAADGTLITIQLPDVVDRVEPDAAHEDDGGTDWTGVQRFQFRSPGRRQRETGC